MRDGICSKIACQLAAQLQDIVVSCLISVMYLFAKNTDEVVGTIGAVNMGVLAFIVSVFPFDNFSRFSLDLCTYLASTKRYHWSQ